MYKRIRQYRVYSTICALLLSIALSGQAQNKRSFFQASDTLHKGRLAGVISSEIALAAGSYIGLQQVWYKDVTKSKWHSFDDFREWQQMDKAGHAYTSYTLGQVGYDMLHWSGVNRNTSIAVGGSLGFVYLLGFEILDAQALEWGFSWSDVGANAFGAALFMGQQWLWDEQRFKLKFSAHGTTYAQYRPNILGDGFFTQMLKDYNGQTYWLSCNIHSFIKKETRFPKWINLAVGYGATGMTGGRTNPEVYNGGTFFANRYRQFYLSLDVDFTKIPVKKPWLKSLFKVLNMIKVPFPALEFNKYGVQGHWIYF